MSNSMVGMNQEISLMNETKFRVIKNTLFPGASDLEAQMVLDYCAARKIDPILKPVHLVPMKVNTDKKDKNGYPIKEERSIVMPGIGLYRIDAARTGQYAGLSEPEYGEDITEKIGGVEITYPKWCKITAQKLMPDGRLIPFTAKEFWKENYADRGKNGMAPNNMWLKRPYGQLAKCTEAQVLRKAFPEAVGNEMTFEEMAGKSLDINDECRENVAAISKKENHARKAILMVTKESMEPHIKSLAEQCEGFIDDIKGAESIEELEQIYDVVKKLNFKDNPQLLNTIIRARSDKKRSFEALNVKKPELDDPFVKEMDAAKSYDQMTGELK